MPLVNFEMTNTQITILMPLTMVFKFTFSNNIIFQIEINNVKVYILFIYIYIAYGSIEILTYVTTR
jgi:hypothetical protein